MLNKKIKEFAFRAGSRSKDVIRVFDRTRALAQNISPSVLVEGDSWVDYPTFATSDIGLQLGKRLPVYYYGLAGDVLSNSARPKNLRRLRRDMEKFSIQAIFTSGGGNDILVEGITQILVSSTRTRRIEINQHNLDLSLDHIIHNQTTIYNKLIAPHPDRHMFTHGYLAPFPQYNGKWIGNYFDEAEYQDVHALLNQIIDTYYARLERFARGKRVQILDIRQALPNNTPSLWADEIHLTESAYDTVAEALYRKIARV